MTAKRDIEAEAGAILDAMAPPLLRLAARVEALESRLAEVERKGMRPRIRVPARRETSR